MYSIIQLYNTGYKTRYASNNLKEIYNTYILLDSINIKTNNKFYIIDNNNQNISFMKLKLLIKHNTN